MKKKAGKVFKVIGIIFLALIVYNIIDLAQAVIFKNTPIISLKTERYDNYTVKYGLLFNTHVYCNNDKDVELAWGAYLRSYHYRGCEKSAKELIKSSLESLAKFNDYKKEDDYTFLTEVLTGSIPTIEKLYKEDSFTDKEATIATSVIIDLADCKDKFELDKWNTTEEFFDIWQKSKCRKKYMKKYKFKLN